jgi:hypothetical protein
MVVPINDRKKNIVVLNNEISGDKNLGIHIQIPTKEYFHSPIRVEKKDWGTDKKKQIFVDMINKKVIIGKQAIHKYQAQIEFYNMPK